MTRSAFLRPGKILLNPGVRPRKRNKFNAKKVCVDAIWFDSVAEAAQYKRLKLLERAGKIKDLKCHPVFQIVINGKPVGRYTPDFTFWDNETKERRYQDVKNPITEAISRFRIKVFEALYGVNVELVGKPGKKWVSFLGYVPKEMTDAEISERLHNRRKNGLARIAASRRKADVVADGQETGRHTKRGMRKNRQDGEGGTVAAVSEGGPPQPDSSAAQDRQTKNREDGPGRS